jgi:class 3 adenylate cyclase/tetratricopeptide (TPR) repeat protein
MDGAGAPARIFSPAAERLGPHVPTVVADWLRDQPERRHQALDCTLVFADISGFTRMTELLGARGRIGAEEMAELINGIFEPLLAAAYAYGAGLIKWGGDAGLLLFRGPRHVQRSCRAACEMQRVMRDQGSLRTSRGPLRLRMSIGVHTGSCDLFLLGTDEHRELIVTGPAATMLCAMEKVAGPGQIVVSDGTAEALAGAGERRPAQRLGLGWLLRLPPEAEPDPVRHEQVDYTGVDIGRALCPIMREYILGGGQESEHRAATIAFVKFSGVDRLLAERGVPAVQEALEHAIGGIQAAAAQHAIAFLASDLGPNGGKVMLSAGAPRRVGHDEDRMIATVRKVLDAGGLLPLRAGVTSGRAFAGDYGPSYRRTYSLMGDCVNLAARLTELGEDWELLGNADLVQAASGEFSAVPRGPFAAKGKQAPVHAFSIGTSRPPGARERAPDGPPLVGREEELATLLAADAAAAAGRGAAVELVGEPGMGKSTLLGELAARSSCDVLWADGDVYAGARPYSPFERLLRRRWSVQDDEPASVLASRLRSVTEAQAPHLLPWLPLIGIAAGLELPVTPEVAQTEATLRKARLEELTSELLGAILSDATTLIFNDVHLMDDASRDLIRRLAADAGQRSWLVVVSRRTEAASPLGDDSSAQRIELGPLSGASAAELLIRATAGAPLPPHRLAALAERASGNPLFLRELAAQLSAGGDPEALPRSVEAAIAARIDRLPATGRRTLRSAAVLGMQVDGPLFDEVVEAEPDLPSGGVERLAALHEFLEPVAPSRWRFSHQLIREVAYEGLPYRRRSELHARTAAAIERSAAGRPEQQAELLAVHYAAGGNHAAAWRFARIAAERARAAYANVEAADSCRRALAAARHLPELAPPDLAAVDETLGEICVELGELNLADVALRRALGRVRGDALATAALQLKLAHLRAISGRHLVALRWATRAEVTLAGLDGPEVRVLRGRLAVRRARIGYRRGRHADGLAFAKDAAELARQTRDRRTLAEALEYGDLCAVEVGLPAGAGAERALAIYEELGDVGAQARVLNTLGLLAYHRGAWPEALARYQAAELAYARAGTRWDAATAVANAAEILADQGRLGEAQAGLERAMLIWRGAGAASEVAFGEYQLGRIAARQGRSAEAAERFAAARAHFLEAGESTEVVMVDALMAEALGLAGDHAAALRLADGTLVRARELGGVGAATPLLARIRAAALLPLGRRDEAEAALREGLEAARVRAAGHEVAFTLVALLDGELEDDPAEAERWREDLKRLGRQLGLELGATVEGALRAPGRGDQAPGTDLGDQA